MISKIIKPNTVKKPKKPYRPISLMTIMPKASTLHLGRQAENSRDH